MIIDVSEIGTIVSNDILAYTYEEREKPTASIAPIIEDTQYFIGDYIVHPYGAKNDLPQEIRDVIQNNYLAPGLLTKKTELLWGSGPGLYKTTYINGKVIKEFVEDKEVQDWLDSFDATDYLLRCCIEYNHIEGVFSRIHSSKGRRVGKGKIAKLEHIPTKDSRLATHKDNITKRPDAVIITDFRFGTVQAAVDYKVYPLFNYKNPLEHNVSAFYSNIYSFCTDYYTVPDLYGSLEWLRRSTNVPLIFKALSNNSLNVKYHIVSPQQFWDDKEAELKDKCTLIGREYESSMLLELKKKILDTIVDVLSSDINAGKFWHTTKQLTVDGTNILEHGWEIKPIDQNVREYVEAQIKISQRADYAVSAGVGLHTALSNISDSGKANGGAEQVYAFKNYMHTGVNIPELIVCKALNYAIQTNFPEKDLKVGFRHELPEKEEDISPNKRLINNSPN